MFEDDEKEFNPSESEEFIKAINEVLDLPENYESDVIDIQTNQSTANKSQLIDIPDAQEETEETLSDSEFDAYDAALAQSLAGMFDEPSAEVMTDKVMPENVTEEKDPPEEVLISEESGEKSEDAITKEIQTDKKTDDDMDLPEIKLDDVIGEALTDDNKGENPEEGEQKAEGEVLLLTDGDFPQEDESEEQNIIDDINAALALQVNEMSAANSPQRKSKKWLLTLIPLVGIAFLFTKIREGMPKWLMGIRIAVFSLFAVLLIGIGVTGGKLIYDIAGVYSRWMMAGEPTTPTPSLKPTQGPAESGPTNAPVLNPDENESESPVQPSDKPPRVEDHVVNILLLGEEKIGSEYGRGRTDLIMIATLDTEQRSVKLTSIMRDILVAIPGHSDDRINSVYGKGGIELLKEVIALNFEIIPDGYMLVDFESFEEIINKLDGVTIELSAEEAEYLNTTNYISNPIYRNVVPGLNKMNGNQALGYCRVRHVPTIDNVYSDFGRTSRQRVVLNAVFEKMKTKNLFQLAIVANSCLPLVETDLTASQISDYMEKAVESKITNFVQMRIPVSGSFTDATYNGITDLIQINYPENIKALHEFIFGNYESN